MDYLVQRDEAVKHIKIADHMLVMTYPLVNDPKILLSVADNMKVGLNLLVSAVLHHEREKKLIPPFHDSDEGRLEAFSNIAKKYNIRKEKLDLIEKVNNIMQDHKNSPMAFSRKNNFVIADEKFENLNMLSVKELKDMVLKAKLFIVEITTILEQE